MPRVPTLDAPDVQPQELPGVREQAPYRMMQMAEIGPGESMRAGQALESAGSDLAKQTAMLQSQQNEAKVKDLNTTFIQGATTILHDPDSGLLNQKGKNAIDGLDPAMKALSDMRNGLMDGIDNPIQRQMFQQATDTQLNAMTVQAQQHVAQQTGVYALEASKARGQAASDAAIQSYNPMPGADNSIFRQGIQTQQVELRAQADQMGLTDPDVRDAYIKNGMAPTYTGLINHLLENNQTAAAKAAFDSIRSELPTAVQDKIQGYLQTSGEKDNALSLAISLKAQTPDLNEQEKILDASFKSGSITSGEHDLALQKLRADYAQVKGEQAENDKQIMGGVWDGIQKGQYKSITDLPADKYAYIVSRDLGPRLEAMFNKDTVVDDARLYNDTAHMAVDDPAAFSKVDLVSMQGQFTKSHYDQLQRMQLAIGKSDVKAMDADKLVHTTVGDVKAQLVAAGFNMNPKPGTDEATNLEQFETGLRDTLVAAQQAKQGTPLTRAEAHDIALGLMKDQTLSGTGVFGMFQSHKPVYQMTPEERAQPWVIPDADRAQIMASLKRRGVPADEASIQAVYKRAQGVR